MTTGRFVQALAAASITGVAVLGFQVPAAVAQPSPGFNCPNPAGNYPPGQCRRAATDDTPQRGQSISVTSGSGSFTPGESVQVRVLGMVFNLTADSTGNVTATFTIPSDAKCGRTNVVFDGASSSDVSVPINVDCAAAAAQRNRALPTTGADHIAELTLAGVGLVAVGGAVVVAARRRRDETPAGIA